MKLNTLFGNKMSTAFHPLSIGTAIFNGSGAGRYVLNTVAVGGPTNEVKIVGGRYNSKQRLTTASVTRKREYDITEGGVIFRRPMIVSTQMTFPDGGTIADLDALYTDLSTWVDASILNRLLLGAM